MIRKGEEVEGVEVGLRPVEEVERGVERLNLSAEGWEVEEVEPASRRLERLREVEEVEVIKYKWGQVLLDPILIC